MSTATDAPVYRLGITQLLAWFFASGDLRGWQTDAAVSAIEGQASHRRIQKRWPTSVQKEAKVAISWCSALCTLRIEGRIDGVEEGNGGLRVIEIKTVRRSPHSLPDAVRERHWLQARLYAALWLAQNPACEALVISLELLYVDLREGTEHHLLDSIERAVLQAFLDHTRDTLLSWFDALTLHRQERNTRLRQLRFPFSAYREGQREMAVSLYRTIREGRMALVEAPTGSGKSLATLFPALKAMGEGLVRQVFFASTRNTGQLSALQALERLSVEGLRILQVQGRERLCPDEPACRGGECPAQRDFFTRLPAARAEALGTPHLTSARLAAIAARHGCCPHGLQTCLMPWMDVLVGDVNYVFAPGNRVDLVFLLNRPLLLADEAHNLPDRARAMFSATLATSLFEDLLAHLPGDAADLRRATRQLSQLLRKPLADDPTSAAQLAAPLEAFLGSAEQWQWQAAEHLLPLDDALAEHLQASIHAARQWQVLIPDVADDFTCLPLPAPTSGRMLVCLSPARLLRRSHGDLGAAVFFSAALTPADFYVRLLGLPDDTLRLRLPSPFPPTAQCTLIYSGLSLRYAERDHPRHLTDVCAVAASVWHAKPGNYWLFAPSFEYLERLWEAFRQQYPDIPAQRQERGMTDAARAAFLAPFTSPPPSDPAGLLGMVVLGSVFTESIDLPGEALIGVIVLGTGQPQPSPVNDAMLTWFQAQGLDGQRLTYELPGWQKIVQAAGRVVRTPSDRGVVVLVDRRFATAGYRNLAPPHWRMQAVASVSAVEQRLAAFWSEQFD